MALLHSPRIITNGLVLCLDAGNSKSYPRSGTAWNDLSGIGNNGTLTNSPTFNSENLGNIQFVSASLQHIQLTTTNTATYDFANTTFTVSAWFRLTTLPVTNGFHYVISKGASATAGGWGLQILETGRFQVVTKTTGGANTCIRLSTTALSTNLWYNITAILTTSTTTIATNNVTMYLNGQLETGTLSQLSTYSGDTTTPIQLARRGGTAAGYMNGNIANAQIYNRALSASEVLNNYNATRSRFGV